MKVIVCILTDKPHSDRVTKLYGCFEHEMFEINAYNVSPPNNGRNDQIDEVFKYRFNWCLHDTAKKYPNHYLLIIKDDVISSSDSNALASSIQEAIHYNQNNSGISKVDETKQSWDILYLSAWGDDCSKYKKLIDIPGYNMYISKTNGPEGSSAFLLSPQYRQNLITKKKLDKITPFIVLPLPFSIDPIFNPRNIPRLNLQRGYNSSTSIQQQNSTSTSTNPAALSFVWFIVIIIIALLIAWALVKYN